MDNPSTITAWAALITIVLVVMTFVVPRKYFLLPYIIGACFVPADQTVMFGELNFQVLRILVLAGMLRLALRGEIVPVRWNRFDKLILAWFVISSIIYTVQWMTLGAFINRCGRFVEWMCLYWVFRQTVRSWKDLRFAYVALAVCAIAMMPFVLIERTTGLNPFLVLGRVATVLREGQFRCQATFPHSIMMGLFWATLVPLFVGFARQKGGSRWLLWGGVAASTVMIMLTASSTPILTLIAVGVLLVLYPLRAYTGKAAWGVVAMLFSLHIVMHAPVWQLIARVGVVSGSTGWHRYYLIDAAIRHFPQWMFVGTRETASWGLGLEDVTNQFILEGVRGGFLSFVLFCVILFVGARAAVRLSLHPRNREESYLAWAVFVTFIGHCLSFLGVAYFGQILMIWYLLLANASFVYSDIYEAPKPAPRGAVTARLQHARC
jgi:hypothetical protein